MKTENERRSGTRIATRIPTRLRTSQGAELPAQTFRVFTHGDRVVELLGLVIDHQHGPAFRAEELRHLLHDDLQT